MCKTSKNLILGLETGLDGGSLSISDGRRVLASASGSGKVSKSEDLLELLEEILKKSEIEKKSLGKIVVSEEPGSLTGIRIGLALAKGLGDALSIPVYKTAILEAMASAVKADGTVVAAFGAQNGKIYSRRYEFEHGKMKIAGETTIKTGLEGLKTHTSDPDFKFATLVLNEALEALLSETGGLDGFLSNPRKNTLQGTPAEFLCAFVARVR